MTVTITPEANLPTLWVIRDRLRLLGALPGRETHLLLVDLPPGSGTPPHRHASPEFFRVTGGEITFTLFDQTPPAAVTAKPGTVVAIDPWVGHNYANTGPGPAAMEVMLDASMVAFFEEVGRADPPPAGPPSTEEIGRVMAACDRHGIEILAPEPVAARA